MKEIWKDVVGYEGYYQISNFGNVRSIERNGTKKGGNLLKLSQSKLGYMKATLQINGKPKTHLVHRLVAQAFIPNPENKKEVNHKDYNRANNCVDNLEWTTRSENGLYSSKNISESKKGAKNGMFGKKAWNSGVKIETTPEMQKNFTKKALNNNELAYIHYENNRYRVRIKFLKINKNFILKEDAIAFRNLKLMEN